MPLQPSVRHAPHDLDIFPASSGQYLARACLSWRRTAQGSPPVYLLDALAQAALDTRRIAARQTEAERRPRG
jgi:hypothetical protein